MLVLITILSFGIQPNLAASYSARPWGSAFPAATLIAFALVRVWTQRRAAAAFLASSAFIAAMLSSAAFGLYPYVLPSRADPQFGLTVANAAAGAYGLRVGLAWWIPDTVLATGYFAFIYRRFARKVPLPGDVYSASL